MKQVTTILIFVSICLINILNAQAPDWQWATSPGSYSASSSMINDDDGNSFVTGYFYKSLIFGTDTLINLHNGGVKEAFIVKYDASGTPLWAKSIKGTGEVVSTGIAIDSNRNVYVVGYYSYSATFENTTLTSVGSSDIFFSKYDSFGTLVWAKNIGGSRNDLDTKIAIDPSNNIIVTGTFNSDSINFENISLIRQGNDTTIISYYDVYNVDPPFEYLYTESDTNDIICSNIFIAKFNSDGLPFWAKNYGGDGGEIDKIKSITSDVNDNIIVTGSFKNNNLNFETTNLVNASGGFCDIFIAKFNPSGALLWSNSFGNVKSDEAESVTVDNNDNIIVTGYYASATINFGNSTLVNTSSNAANFFLVKFNSLGTTQWAKTAGGNQVAIVSGATVATDDLGNIVVSGAFFYDSVSFEGMPILNTSTGLSSAGHYDSDFFIVKYNNDGNILWLTSANGTGGEEATGIFVDASDNIYMTGYYSYSTVTFGSTSLNSNIGAGNHMFLAKLGNPTTASTIENFENTTISIFPNPFMSESKVVFNKDLNSSTLKMLDISGQEVKSIRFSGKELIIEKGNLCSGIYFVKIIDGNNEVANKKIVIQ